jgi:hypothetical protein
MHTLTIVRITALLAATSDGLKPVYIPNSLPDGKGNFVPYPQLPPMVRAL